jgi:hypothetical protein
MDRRNIHVVRIDAASAADAIACGQAMKVGNCWTIDFISDVDLVRRTLSAPGITWTFVAVPDYAGRPIVVIGHPVFPGATHGT